MPRHGRPLLSEEIMSQNLYVAVFFALTLTNFACSSSGDTNGDPNQEGAPPDASLGSEEIDASVSTPEAIYKDIRRRVEFSEVPISCEEICSDGRGRCVEKGDSDSRPSGGSDYLDCFGRADYIVPRAHFQNEAQNYFPSEDIACEENAPASYDDGAYELYAVECCCILQEPHWIDNSVTEPQSCDAVCAEQGLECDSYDLCRQVPTLCSESFPEFIAQSVARYRAGGNDVGREEYPECAEVPAASNLQSHSCACF